MRMPRFLWNRGLRHIGCDRKRYPRDAPASNPGTSKRSPMRAAVRVLAGSVVVLTACQDLQEPTGPQALPQYAKAAVATSGMADQALIARAVPEFGGMYIDAQGTPTVYVTDLSEA